FQTSRDLRNFLDCVDRLMPGARITQQTPLACIHASGRKVWAGVFPIGVDFDDFASRAAAPSTLAKMEALRAGIGPYRILLGIDRLDYTKGLVERLHALERAFELYP